MQRSFWMLTAALLLGPAWPETGTAAGTDGGGSPAMTSTKDHGVVSIVPDPVLSDGRLVFKVVAFNRMRTVTAFGPEDVKVFTAAGQPVGIESLEQLVQEARGARGTAQRNVTAGYSPGDVGGPLASPDRSGRVDVSAYTGSARAVEGVTSTAGTGRPAPGGDDPKLKAQIAALNAAILHPLTIASAAADGGQVVTEAIKFARKDERSLRVVVAFNGEEHEFRIKAPPPR